VNENMKDGTDKATARRRLIRGAFGAPVALTLYSGNVAASSNLRALANQIAKPYWPDPVSSLATGDTWIRVPVYSDKIQSVTTDIVLVSDLLGKPSCGVTVEAASYVSVATFKSYTPSKQFDAKVIKYAALRYDKDGFIIGVIASKDDSTAGGTALTASAGTSLTVVACGKLSSAEFH
jgi:hypothetical protein